MSKTVKWELIYKNLQSIYLFLVLLYLSNNCIFYQLVVLIMISFCYYRNVLKEIKWLLHIVNNLDRIVNNLLRQIFRVRVFTGISSEL